MTTPHGLRLLLALLPLLAAPPLWAADAGVPASGACDPHGVPKASTPTTILQNIDFLLTGTAKNFCTGLCDGDVPDEIPLLPANCPVAP